MRPVTEVLSWTWTHVFWATELFALCVKCVRSRFRSVAASYLSPALTSSFSFAFRHLEDVFLTYHCIAVACRGISNPRARSLPKVVNMRRPTLKQGGLLKQWNRGGVLLQGQASYAAKAAVTQHACHRSLPFSLLACQLPLPLALLLPRLEFFLCRDTSTL